MNSIADILAYEEISQLEVFDLRDLSEFPNIQAWLKDMRRLPGYNKTHAIYDKLQGMVNKRKQQMAQLQSKL